MEDPTTAATVTTDQSTVIQQTVTQSSVTTAPEVPQCRFIVDIDVDVSTMDDASKANVKWRLRGKKHDGRPNWEPYFPAGTVYEHDNAAHFVDVGCALPANDACAARAIPMTDAQRKTLEQNYKADAAGINDAHDRELFFAGVISGYEEVGNQVAYVPGPNYAAWKAAQDEAAAKKANTDI